MEGNKYLYLNPRECEKYLSPLGKEVLHILIKQWDKGEQASSFHKSRHCSRTAAPTKKILNFINEPQLTPNITPSQPPPIQIHSTEIPSNIKLGQEIVPEMLTCEEFTKTLDTSKYTHNDEFIHPTIVRRNAVRRALDCDGELDNTSFETVKRIGRNMDRIEPDVNWDNIFDSEFFADDNENVSNKEVINELKISDDVLGKECDKDITNLGFNEENYIKSGGKRKNKNIVNTRNIKKSKKQKTNQNEPPIKCNKSNDVIPKNCFRKQTYTKTVKNWLNDVESYNPINDIDTEIACDIIYDNEITKTHSNIQENSPNSFAKNHKPKLIVDKSKKDSKKVVQAQLANKDGIMKFSKPKTETAQSNTETANIKIVKNKKDKESKKFVPPIKSQTPVKDITYEIIIVDDNNIDDQSKKMNCVKGSEVIAVLIYSNGFCQLNSHFTDDTCAVEGLLLGTGDVFYYFKGSNQKIKETLIYILDSNTVISYEARNIFIYFVSQFKMDTIEINMYDVQIGASLIDPDNPPENFSELQKLVSFTAPYTIATECSQQKAAWYTSLLKECWIKLKEILVESQLWTVFVEIEMKLLPIIAEMERHGVLIDLSKLKSMEAILMTRMKQIEQECYKVAGKTFQLNSTLQVRNILYEELKLDSKSNVKIKETISGGLKSTSEAMLRSLMSVHELPRLILEYRHLHKAHTTFLAGIAQHVRDNVVRPTWMQTAAATGRIASNNPNLQAIPKMPFKLVMFPDASDTDAVQLNFRSPYVARAGHALVAADFKHVECRVFAHVAADAELARALARDSDLFTVLAALWLNKSEDSVTGAERDRTKRLVYASLYGAGTRKLMEILDVSYEQTLQVAASFNRTFPSLKAFGRGVAGRCAAAGGQLRTLCGRARRLAHIVSADGAQRAHAERQAVNFVVQGSAADLCKKAMIETTRQLRDSCPPLRARLLLQIHDELVWHVPRAHVPAAAGIIKRVMEGCGRQCGMSLPLPVAITVGDNWGEMEPYDPPSS